MAATILPAANLAITQMQAETSCVGIELAPAGDGAACPLCGRRATRVQSRYLRTLADLPWQGAAVRVHLHIRRFWCDGRDCPRVIFAERVPELAAPYARRTARLAGVLTLVGFALGGEGGSRLLAALGMAASPDTVLRLVRSAPLPDAATPRVLGVDDFALRRGHTYGTLLVDLERHAPVELLPERTSAGFAAWLAERPGVEIISRDRGGAYAEGARQGAPDATQVADRWHLLKNIGDALERVLGRQREALRAAAAPPPADPPPAAAPPDPPDSPTPMHRAPAETPGDARRRVLHREAHALRAEGLSLSATARRLGLTRTTVRKYLRASTVPVRAARRTQLGPLGRHEAYLRERWAAGCDNAAELWRELRAQGFPGSAGAVRRYLGTWRATPRSTGRQRRGSAGPPAPAPPSPAQARWWLLRPPERRTARQQAYLDRLLADCPPIQAAATLAREFGRLIRERDLVALEPWLAQAEGSGLAEFAACAASLRLDEAAVAAALTHEWSAGQTEGQVTRLKLLKRQMFGRAKFDLLRRRVLHRAA
jgi:transposase